ncbi:serine protease [Mycoplasmatota bacterium WC30]
MRYKKKKDSGLGKFILSIFLIALGYLALTIIGNIAYDYIRSNQPIDTSITTTAEEENTEAILLATKLKLTAANIYIQVYYDSGYEIGSGTIINEDESYYYALTNYHVIDGNNEVIDSKLAITFDDVSSDFEVVAMNQDRDLALIKIVKTGRDGIIPLNLAGNVVHVNEIAVAIGNPFGEIGTINYGSVLRATYLQELELSHSVIEHNATLANGSSGGALVDLYGNLIGINTWELNGKYYAIPISVINIFLENIL